MSEYLSVNYNVDVGSTEKCYLCGRSLDLKTTPDHIIPKRLFEVGDPYKPCLPVHHVCNNQKSLEDRWFVKHIQLRSSFDNRAEGEFSDMMNKAKAEKNDAYIIGKKLRNYKLARTMFDNAFWGLEFQHNGKQLKQLQIPLKEAERFKKYVELMCQGLFIRNVVGSKPPIPELIIKQYVDLELKGKDVVFMESIKSFVDQAKNSKFGQRWGDKISYIGSRVVETPDKGFLFVQFYSQIGILAIFG